MPEVHACVHEDEGRTASHFLRKRGETSPVRVYTQQLSTDALIIEDYNRSPAVALHITRRIPRQRASAALFCLKLRSAAEAEPVAEDCRDRSALSHGCNVSSSPVPDESPNLLKPFVHAPSQRFAVLDTRQSVAPV
jgi:hypothetical protein